jgi:hypothetical protein
MIRFPQQRTSVITLCNVATADPSRLARRVADVFLADRLGPAASPNERPADESSTDDEFSVPVSQLRQYQGRYVSRELGVTYAFEIRDGRLVASLPLRWDRPLRALGEGVFADPEAGFELRFRRDSAGGVDGFALDWGRVTGVWFERIG